MHNTHTPRDPATPRHYVRRGTTGNTHTPQPQPLAPHSAAIFCTPGGVGLYKEPHIPCPWLSWG